MTFAVKLVISIYCTVFKSEILYVLSLNKPIGRDMMSNSAHKQYKDAQYKTASQEKLLLMLYEGAISFSNQAIKKMNEEDHEEANEKIKRVQAIINELMVTLDMDRGGEIANNLYNLYEYMNRRLIQANIRKDSKIVEEVLNLLKDLKDGWDEAVKKLKSQGRQAQTQQAGGVNIEG